VSPKLVLTALALAAAAHGAAAQTSILFVGNSYTFGRTDGSLLPNGSLNTVNQVLTYNAGNVRDLTAPRGNGVLAAVNTPPPYTGAPFTNVVGTNSYPIGMNIPGTSTQGNSYSPHTQTNTWGGTAGIFKQFTVQAGLNYDVALSTRNAASLRGHLLNTANANWDLRSNIGSTVVNPDPPNNLTNRSQPWANVVLQEQSDEALGPRTTTQDGDGRTLINNGTTIVNNTATLGSNFPSTRAYVDLIEDWVHTGKVTIAPGSPAVTSYTEQAMFRAQFRPPGGTDAQADAACQAAGGGAFCTNTTTRTLGENLNANPNARIFLQQTWARPDLINAPGEKTLSPVTALATYNTAIPAPSYFPTLEAMTNEMATQIRSIAAYAALDGSGGITGIIPTGEAFLRAVQQGVATRNMYASNALTDGLIDLWFNDGTHPSKWGSYLSALTVFGTVTGLNPLSLGANEIAAADLGISRYDAVTLQSIAAQQLGFPVPEPSALAMWSLALAVLGWQLRGARRRA